MAFPPVARRPSLARPSQRVVTIFELGFLVNNKTTRRVRSLRRRRPQSTAQSLELKKKKKKKKKKKGKNTFECQ